MIIALLTGMAGSKSIVNKNMTPVLGRPLAFYRIAAAKQSELLDAIYLTTDSPPLKKLAQSEAVNVINRPPELSKDNSELVDAIVHALSYINQPVEILVTMHCNCAVHRPGLVNNAIRKLIENPTTDSVISGCTDRSIHPYRTRRISEDGTLKEWFKIPPDTSSSRQNLDPCFIFDGAVRALRVAICFPPAGSPPFSYFGTNVMPIENVGRGDIHSPKDIIIAEYLLRQMGWKIVQLCYSD